MNKEKKIVRTREYKDMVESIRGLAGQLHDLNKQAVKEYSPLVDAIIRSRSRDVNHIEHTLDSLLSFCGYDPALQLYRRLCRHYYEIDPKATAEHVYAYREMWDEGSLKMKRRKKAI
jgi:hypothetical protein